MDHDLAHDKVEPLRAEFFFSIETLSGTIVAVFNLAVCTKRMFLITRMACFR